MKHYLLGISAVLCVLGSIGIANARSIQANAGNAQDPSNETCMRTAWAGGGISNACGHSVVWNMPLVVDRSGSYMLSVWGYADGGTSCTAWSMNADGTIYDVNGRTFSSPIQVQSLVGAGDNFPIFVANGGYLMLECNVAPWQIPGGTTKIYSVNWQ